MFRIRLQCTLSFRLVAVVLATLLIYLTTAILADAQTPAPTPATPEPTPTAVLITHTLIGRANCLICHKDGFGDAQVIPTDHAQYSNAECRDCHAPSVSEDLLKGALDLSPDAVPRPLAHPAGEGQNTCYDCHVSLDDKHSDLSAQWTSSVHGQAGIGCADCHGGDPRTDEMNQSMDPEAGFVGAPPRIFIPGICGGCHSDSERMRQYSLPTDQYQKYMSSVHGAKLRETSDTRVAVCTDCHGVHDIKKASDPSAAVYPLNIPELCSGCHSDAKLMQPYNIPTDQYDVYQTSVHGQAVLVRQDMRAATCTSCHGSHAAKPPDDVEVINVCGKCHTATQALYEESLHSRLGEDSPRCWTCHGTHDVSTPDEGMFVHEGPIPERPCGTCHVNEQSFRMNKARFVDREDRRCDTCHHEGSMIMAQVTALRQNLLEATEMFSEAEQEIHSAQARGMIVMEAESKLSEAHTSLIMARATLHTTKLPRVTQLTDDTTAAATAARDLAAVRLAENVSRRIAMIVAIGAISVNVAVLYAYRRKLYQQLE